MKTILSIQSHVASGHVGNSAAVFPLQRLGFEVVAINTVQFSNHTGYGDWTGQVFTSAHIADVLDGLERRGVLSQVDALLTGYLGDPAIGNIILDMVKSRLPHSALWLCDPVMGDVGRGFFVREGIPAFFKDCALPRANIITPNQFELEYLTGHPVRTLEDAKTACDAAHKMGPDIILLTSLLLDASAEDEIQMLASVKGGGKFIVTTPRLPFDPQPNGAGDVTAALFLAHTMDSDPVDIALGRTAGGIFSILEKTKAAGARELSLIAAQEDFVEPPYFSVTAL